MTHAERLSEELQQSPRVTASGRKLVWKCEIGDLRHKLRLTQRDVEAATGVSSAVLCTIEHGTDPQLTTARKLADFFGRTVEELWPERLKEAQ